jgi:iron complex transport system permease protein
MKAWALYLALGLALIAGAIASLLAGPVWIDPRAAMSGALAPEANLAKLIILDVRLPRLVLGLLIGGILGLSGAVLQGLLRNPLAEPGLLGVSMGASLGAVIAIYYGFAATAPLASPLFGLVGGLLASGLALLLARRGGGTLGLILAGSAIAAIAGAGVSLALNLSPNPYAAYEIMTWLMGSLADRSWDHVQLAAPFILAGGVLLFLTARGLGALALGEAQAESLGVSVSATRILALTGVALGVGAATAVSGAIGFVGLVAPHVVRPFVGHDPGRTLFPAALAGAVIVTAADVATRLVRVGPGVNLGVFISLIGAPFFLWLVLRLRRVSP